MDEMIFVMNVNNHLAGQMLQICEVSYQKRGERKKKDCY